MLFKNSIRFASLYAALFVFASIALAQGPVAGTDTTTSNLTMNATVASTLQLNISTHATGATVSGSTDTGIFAVDLGSVNGLGTGTPATNVAVVADATGALYSTYITLTPVFTGFGAETAAITVSNGLGDNQGMAREDGAVITAGSTVGATPLVVAPAAATNVAIARHVGLYVPRTETAGGINAVLVYTITMHL
jgi:hypothetical protein